MATLRVTTGPRAGETIEVIDELVVGRQDADVTIDDPEISRRHAVVRPVAGGLEVEDLGSTNGTLVDGERIQRTVRLRSGSRIELGGTVIEVVELAHEAGDTTLERTRARAVPRDVGQPQPTEPEVASPQAAEPTMRAQAVDDASGRPQPVQPVLPFQPRAARRRGGLASRSWVPVVLSFGTVVLTAVALVIYFASR